MACTLYPPPPQNFLSLCSYYYLCQVSVLPSWGRRPLPSLRCPKVLQRAAAIAAASSSSSSSSSSSDEKDPTAPAVSAIAKVLQATSQDAGEGVGTGGGSGGIGAAAAAEGAKISGCAAGFACGWALSTRDFPRPSALSALVPSHHEALLAWVPAEEGRLMAVLVFRDTTLVRADPWGKPWPSPEDQVKE